jgi:hypothetical protein
MDHLESFVSFLMSVPDKSLPPMAYAELVQLNDEALMLRLQLGHHDALAVLFDRYHRLVMTIALRILRSAGEAEDLSAERRDRN